MSEPPDRQLPPPERFRKGDNIIEISVLHEGKAGYKSKAGELVAFNATECSLDLMYHRGHLGNRQDDAERRHAAGMWLRQLFLKLHGSIGVASYHDAWHHFTDISSHMSEVDAWNFKCMLDTREHMGSMWRPLECVCIMDRRYGKAWPALHNALDVLADYRGI